MREILYACKIINEERPVIMKNAVHLHIDPYVVVHPMAERLLLTKRE